MSRLRRVCHVNEFEGGSYPFGETDDSDTLDGNEKYQMDVYNVVMDQVVTSSKSRFADHEKLCQDFAVLDPCQFDECSRVGLPQSAFESICQKLGKHVDPVKLREQLVDFHHSFPRLVKTLPEALRSSDEGNIDEESEDSETDSDSRDKSDDESVDVSLSCRNKSCKSCFNCAYKLLHEYGLNSSAYTELYTAYKYLVTLAVTQAASALWISCWYCSDAEETPNNNLLYLYSPQCVTNVVIPLDSGVSSS